MKFSCSEMLLKKGVTKMGRTLTMGRVAVLTRDHNGRQACHYCGPCEQGCITFSYYNSPTTTIAAAEKTGRLTLMTDAVASHVTTDRATGLASGVAYIDRVTRVPRSVKAKIVLLCASTLESTRLLLNSSPGGLANDSGVLGHHLMDHIYQGGASGTFPELKAEPWVGPPRRPTGIYIPRFRNVDRASTNGFIRGYGYQGRGEPSFAMKSPGFGAGFKKAVRENGSWGIGITAWCECLPRMENYVELDTEKTDAWGIPTLKIHMKWSDNELALWKDSREQAAETLEAAGAKNVAMNGEVSVPGFCIHEVGTARMGNDPSKSVLNRFNQTHEVKNLFVTDGAAWVTIACQNPTLTMLAITARACDYIVDQHKKGELA
jgi:choline dehydrogenase-like flavoprotein